MTIINEVPVICFLCIFENGNPSRSKMHEICLLLLEGSLMLWVYKMSAPYAHKDPRFLFEKIRATLGILIARLNNRW